MMFQIDGRRIAMTVRIRKKVGNESMTSISAVMSVSTRRRRTGPIPSRRGP